MKVLVAVDGSADTKKMLAYLTTHEGLLGLEPVLSVLNVQSSLPPRAASTVGKQVVTEYYKAESEKVLSPVCKFLDRHGYTYKTNGRVGHAADEILKEAKKVGAELIVMGSRGHGSIGSFLLGSVAQKVLSGSDIPVMIVR